MALRDIYDANKTAAKDQERAVVGTQQQQKLGSTDSGDGDAEDPSLPLPSFREKNVSVALKQIVG